MTLVREYQPTFVLGDGETKEFSYLFEEVSENFIKVIVKHSDDSTYTPVFSVDLDSHKVVFGESETAPLNTDVVCIYRNTPDLQDTPFRTLQGYDARALENILSKIVAMIQELKANGFSTQILQGTPWQLDLLHPDDDGASVVVDYNARILKKGLYFQIVSGNLQVSADGSSFITMPKSADITEFRCLETVLEDLTVIRKLQYKVNNVWYDAEHNAQATADEALDLAQTVQSDLSSHKLNHNNPHETSLGNLTDTDFTNLQTNQFLKFNGTKWVNVYSSAVASWGGIIGNITDQTDLMNKFSEYVKTDGSSTMTNPLMMRATEDFKCAIAPYWDGVGFFKLNDNNSVTLMASIEYNSGFEPATTNAYNIGASARKWKNLYLAGKAYVATINNGADLSVPNKSGTLATMDDVELAARSGRMLTDQGVWYAKMYAATVPPAAENGKNYADFSQVDSDNNPIIVIYEGQAGMWVQSETITPPADYDGYVPVTSKIWDITEQSGQQGGRVLWNHTSKEFTPYPTIISFENAALTGVSTAPTPTSTSPNNQIATKGYVDSFSGANRSLSNLTSAGANIGNWSSNVSNCITEIPQDIKLELSSGILTLKAGSKVYVPNGAGVFDIENVTSDMTVSAYGTDATQFMVFVRPSAAANKWSFVKLNNQYSGPTEPASQIGTQFWYDTTNNFIKSRYNSGDWVRGGYSLPIAIVTSNGSSFTSIDQVFNGFGYIGSTVFALPGLKGLIPNGRNADGSLKNTEIAINTVQTLTPTQSLSLEVAVILEPKTLQIGYCGFPAYNEAENLTYDTITKRPYCQIGTATLQASKITAFTPKTVFHAVDYNEADFVVDFQRPTAQNNYTWYRKYKSGWVEQGGVATTTNTSTPTQCNLPVAMADGGYCITYGPTTQNMASVFLADKQTTYFSVITGVQNIGYFAASFNWMVCGMAAN